MEENRKGTEEKEEGREDGRDELVLEGERVLIISLALSTCTYLQTHTSYLLKDDQHRNRER